MKKMALVVAVAFAFVGIFSGVASAKDYKIAYVDLAKVFDEYGKTKDAEKVLTEKGKAKEAERKKFVDELRKMKDEQALLSEKAKVEKQKVIDEKLAELQDFDRKSRDELIKDRNDMLGGIMKDIEKVMNDYAKEKGYDIILNSRTLLYGSPDGDVTSDVLKRLNK